MNVPRIKLASINVTAVLRVAITMIFNTHTKKWTSTAKQFRVELLSFKGYLCRSMLTYPLIIVALGAISSCIFTLHPHIIAPLLSSLPSI